MPKRRQNRLAQTHKLSSLSNHLVKTSNFTTEEVKLLLLIHQKLEEYGPIERTRFREILCVVFAITDDVMLDLVFRAFDKDNDGFVDDIEWIHGMSTMLRGTMEQLVDYTYSVYDMNGDGSLAREELHHCLKGCLYSGYGLDDDEVEDCERDIVEIAMKKLDYDRDGQITYKDFVRAVKKDALLLQACGSCLPSSRAASAFQSLITERYQQHSALYPKMPAARIHTATKNKLTMRNRSKSFSLTKVQSNMSNSTLATLMKGGSATTVMGGGGGAVAFPVGGAIPPGSNGSNRIQSLDVDAPRASKVDMTAHNNRARLMSLSVVRTLPLRTSI